MHRFTRARALRYSLRAGMAMSLSAILATSALAQMGQPVVVPSPNDPKSPTEVPNTMLPTKQRGKVDLAGGVQLLPRAILFGNPQRASARISPDGKLLAFLAPLNGVLNVHVVPVGTDLAKAKPVTNDTNRGIRSFFWAYTSEHVVYTQDKGGDENWRVHSVNVNTGAEKDLTPMDNVAANIEGVSEKFPEEIVVGLNDRNPQFHDLHRLNISTGELKLLQKNVDPGNDKAGFAGFTIDDDYRVRFAYAPRVDGSLDILKHDGKGGFEPYESIPMEDSGSTSIVGFNRAGTVAYMLDGRNRNTSALFAVDVESKKREMLLEDDRTDVSGVMINPITKEVEAVETTYERSLWNLLDASLQPDFMAIRTQAGMGDFQVSSRSKDDRYWTVTMSEDDAPSRTFLMDRGDLTKPNRKPQVSPLFYSRPELIDKPLVPMHAVVIKARDGLEMVSYLSLPLEADSDRDGKPENPVPLVLNVHGGPWARDVWGLDPEAQWLANRGYAVLQVNFRGSTGFGKKHLNAANLEWAGKMHDDLLDAVKWAVDNKITTADKVAIMGGSYGGYATLVGMTFTPDVFACGVSIVGPSNLNTLLKSIPAYWAPMIDLMTRRVGDHRTEEGSKFLESRSPLTFVSRINKPLLIGQGANDPRVKQAESDQIVAAMSKKNIPVTYVLYPDEGHGFARPENRMSFYAVAEQFLAKHLGGRAEPIGDAFKGSTIQIPTGAEGVAGVAEAIKAASAADSKPSETKSAPKPDAKP